jgi:hypothetical protein
MCLYVGAERLDQSHVEITVPRGLEIVTAHHPNVAVAFDDQALAGWREASSGDRARFESAHLSPDLLSPDGETLCAGQTPRQPPRGGRRVGDKAAKHLEQAAHLSIGD